MRVLNSLLMVGIPVGAALYYWRKGTGGFRPIWIGALVFILSQIGHVPFDQFLMLPGLTALGIDAAAEGGVSLWILGAAAGLSAGLFEEFARFLALKFWLKKDPHSLLPVKYGVGHGGIEALLLGLLTVAALIQVLVFRNESAFAALPADQAELARSQIEAYWAVPLSQLLLGAWERVSAMFFHIGASILVYKTVRSGNWLWLGAAILGHLVLDAFAVIAIRDMDYILLELILFVFASAWLFWAWKIREGDPQQEEIPPPPAPVQVLASQATSKQIEESKYD